MYLVAGGNQGTYNFMKTENFMRIQTDKGIEISNLRVGSPTIGDTKMEDEIVKPTNSDAKSTKLDEDWNDLPFAALMMAAKRFNLGRQIYGKDNWKKGDSDFAEVRLSHCIRHLILFTEYKKIEDLEASICNLMMICWYVHNAVMRIKPNI